jgi:hypothetical protein
MRTEKAQEEADKLKCISSSSGFDEDFFDEEVSVTITDIHKRSKYNERNNRYKKWCVKNIEELQNMFILANVDCSFNEFCSFVFQSGSVNPL